ncbi:hypothetical protein [Caudoviricetes sp.]|nr:hypothetical protein [Caudoviricetes sp.]
MKKFLGLLAALSIFVLSSFFVVAADCTRATDDPIDGDVFYAADYVSELNNLITCVNARAQDVGDIFTGDVTLNGGLLKIFNNYFRLYSDAGTTLKFEVNGANGNTQIQGGGDVTIYSDAATTTKLSIDGATGKTVLGLTEAGQSTNCGITNIGTTFTVTAHDATALSATNPCVIAVRSSTAGGVELTYFTDNATFTHGSSSDTDGNLFGILDANWSSAMPFFLGVVTNGTSKYFTISRLPFNQTGSASSALCQKGDTSCDDQADVMILTTGLTLTSWVDLPITQIGWFQMTYATSGGAWTAATTTKTGFNYEYEKIRWAMVTGQNGGATSTYLLANGGTAPLFTKNQYTYQIDRSGMVDIDAYLANDPGTDGAGAVQAAVALPYYFESGTLDLRLHPVGFVIGSTTITSSYILYGLFTEGTYYMELRYVDANAVVQSITNAMFSSGSRQMTFTTSFNAMSN